MHKTLWFGKPVKEISYQLNRLKRKGLRHLLRNLLRKYIDGLEGLLNILKIKFLIKKVPWSVYINKPKNKFYLAGCAVFKNEAPYLKEWIGFHSLIGVEKFYLYNNQSTDDFMPILRPYIDNRVITLYDIKIHPGQVIAYNHCLKNHSRDARWLAFIDIDEFLFPTHEDNLRDILKDYEQFPAIGVHWLLFGSSNHIKKPKGLIIENCTKRSEINFWENERIKSIVNPQKTISWSTNTHHGLYINNGLAVNENKQLIKKRLFINRSKSKKNSFGVFTSSPVTVSRLRINHYWSKSLEEYKAKMNRGRATTEIKRNIDWFYGRDKYCNQIEDLTIARFIPELKARLLGPG